MQPATSTFSEYAAIYPRQSVDKKDSLSIEFQIKCCTDYCASKNWPYKIYGKDKGYSGKNLRRPSFEELMADVRSGKITKIICYRFDRISRNISDFSNLMVELQNYKCEFISLSENFDTSTPIGRAMVYICMVFAQMERESIAERVTDNYYYRTELGFWGGGPPPYGYRLKRISYNGKMHTVLDPDPETAKIVNLAADLYLEPNGSVPKILDYFNNIAHIPSPNKSEWTSRVLVDILSRPLYAPNDMNMYNYLSSKGASILNPPEQFDGELSVNLYGKKNEGLSKHKRCRDIGDMYCNIIRHPSIMNSEKWIRIQNKRDVMLKKPKRSGTGKNSYFTGLMKCGCCNRGVSYTNSHGTQGYYICSTRKNKGWNSCSMPPASKKKTDPAIIAAIIEHYSKESIRKKIHSASPAPKERDQLEQREYNQLLSHMATLDSQIDKLITTLSESTDITTKYVNARIEQLDLEKNKLTQKLAAFNNRHAVKDTEYMLLKRIDKIIDSIPTILQTGTFEEIKDLCNILVRQITFCEDGGINIEYTI